MNKLIDKLSVPIELETLIRRAKKPIPVVLSISGGKDSDSLCELVPQLIQQRGWTDAVELSLVHTDMGPVAEWGLTPSYIPRRAQETGLPLTVVSLRK